MATAPTPLLLLPAMLCDGQLWAAQIETLSRVATPLFGDLTQDDSIGAMAARMLASAPARFAVAGVGLGGHVAIEMIRQAPGRVERVALFGTRGTVDRRIRAVERQGALATAPHADPQLTPILSGKAQAMAERIGSDAFARQQQALLARPDHRAVLHGLTVPTLVAVGDRDRICTRADALALADQVPGADFRLFAGCGHLAPLERPGAVTSALSLWLRDAPRGHARAA